MSLGLIGHDAFGAALEVGGGAQAAVNDRLLISALPRHQIFQSALDHRLGRAVSVLVVNQPLFFGQLFENSVRGHRISPDETKLIELGSRGDDDRERPRHDLDIQIARVAFQHVLEFQPAVGDQPRENIQPSGGALGIGLPANIVRQGEAFQQRHDVDRIRLQQRRPAQVILRDLELRDLVPQRHRASRKEAGLHAVGDVPQAQVHGGGLNLRVGDFRRRANFAVGDQFADLLRRQDPRFALRAQWL